MTDQSLAQASDIAVWVTMLLLTVAMLAFAAHLAITGSRKDAEARALSEGMPRADSAGSVGSTLTQFGDGTPGAGDPGAGGPGAGVAVLDQAESSPPPTRRWGVIGLQVTWLATFALMAAVALRGLSVGRAPLGNMYEFALVAAMFTLIVFSGWSLRRDRLWLGLFVALPVLLIALSLRSRGPEQLFAVYRRFPVVNTVVGGAMFCVVGVQEATWPFA